MHSSLFTLFTLSIAGLISAYDPVKMLCMVNQERANNYLQPLGMSDELAAAAQAHSDDQARMRSMTHSGSDGSSPSTRVSRAGFNWRAVAENVAYGYSDEEECMKQWMASSGHRANILGSYQMFGSAVSSGGGTPYYTQNFGTDSGGVRNVPKCDGSDSYTPSPPSAPSSDYNGGGSSPSSGSNYGGGSSPSSGSNYGGSRPSSNYNGGSRPSSNYNGGSSPSSNYNGGSRPSSNYGGSRPSSNNRPRRNSYNKPTKSYGGDVQDSNDSRYGHRHSHGGHRNNSNTKPTTSYGSKKPTSNTRPTYTPKKPSSYGGAKPSSGSKPSYGGAKPSSGSKPSSGGAYKTTTTYRKA